MYKWEPREYENPEYPYILIKKRSDNKWCIQAGTMVLNNEGHWEFEPSPSNRTEEFIKRTRFPLETAIQLTESIKEKDKK